MDEPQYHLEGVLKSKQSLNESFDGPLDVILQLLSKNKIEIQDVRISAILEQYLNYLDEMKRMDMEIASEFIAMASYLMLIKTKMLLSAAERAEAQSEMDLLRQTLAERQRKEAFGQIKNAMQFLEGRNEIGCNLFTKQPEPFTADKTYRYVHERQDLISALQAIADRTERKLPPPIASFSGIVGTEPYPVTKKAAELLQRLAALGAAKFRKLFRGSRSRSEIVATFLAVLELCRLRNVAIDGDDGEPTVRFLTLEREEQEATDGAN